MRYINSIAIFIIVSCSDSFGQNNESEQPSRWYVSGSITSFENRINLFNMYPDGREPHYSIEKETATQFELGFDYRLKKIERLKIGGYYAYKRGGEILFFRQPITLIGARSKYYILPKFIKEKTSGIFDVYAIGKAGFGLVHGGGGFLAQAGLGFGVTIYPTKNLGVFLNYDHSWFDRSQHHIGTQYLLNQHFFHFGFTVKPALNPLR